MADRHALKFVGFLFAVVTVSVMLTAVMVVKGHADGRFSLDAASAQPAVSTLTRLTYSLLLSLRAASRQIAAGLRPLA